MNTANTISATFYTQPCVEHRTRACPTEHDQGKPLRATETPKGADPTEALGFPPRSIVISVIMDPALTLEAEVWLAIPPQLHTGDYYERTFYRLQHRLESNIVRSEKCTKGCLYFNLNAKFRYRDTYREANDRRPRNNANRSFVLVVSKHKEKCSVLPREVLAVSDSFKFIGDSAKKRKIEEK